MKTKIIYTLFLFCVISIEVTSLKANNTDQDNLITIPVEVIVDKIRGGMLGQILGNLNGLRHEMRYIDEPGNVKNYVPRLPDGARTDDDTDFEWFYICEMQKNRDAFLSYDYITKLWVERVNKGVYCSNRYVRYLMDIGMKPPYTGYTSFNPWAEFNISGQFLCETYGLLAPGMPQTAANIGLNYTRVAINNEPAQTTQLFTSMIATAFFEDDIHKILDAGIATLDKTSIILEIITDVKNWHNQHPDDWRQTRRLLKDKYTQENGRTRDRNGHELNTGATIAAFLYGKGDYTETMKHCFNFGWDADNTAATAGTILGVIYGYRKILNHNDPYKPQYQIVDRYTNTTRDNMPMDETITSFSDRIIELFEMINENNGGSKIVENNTMVYKIPFEQPAPIIKLIDIEEQKKLLQEEFENQIKQDIVNGTRQEKARAAYIAICLDMNDKLAKNNPKQWKEACYDLSGYWKVMNNIFFGDFKALELLKEKFQLAGFKTPVNRASSNKLYNDDDFWKDPKELY